MFSLFTKVLHIRIATITVQRNDGVNKGAGQQEEQAVVSIKDTGTGIDSEIFPRLFARFATKSEMHGTGLGLFISKGIVESHGGRIWAENNRNEKGATFSFSLPLSNNIPIRDRPETSCY